MRGAALPRWRCSDRLACGYPAEASPILIGRATAAGTVPLPGLRGCTLSRSLVQALRLDQCERHIAIEQRVTRLVDLLLPRLLPGSASPCSGRLAKDVGCAFEGADKMGASADGSSG